VSLTEGMSLGELIANLEGAPPGGVVRITSPIHMVPVAPGPDRWCDSYRGYYEDLAIIPCMEDEDGKPPPPPSAYAYAKSLRALVGTRIEGYKGGDSLVLVGTPVWVSPWGEASGARVVGVQHRQRRQGNETISVWLQLRMIDR
jgi:hypothetical protein